jgi:tetratricopeptide (TPR) repeat protein
MKRSQVSKVLAVFLFFAATAAFAKWPATVVNATHQAQDAQKTMDSPTATPAEKQRAAQTFKDSVNTIVQAGQDNPTDTNAQLAVGKALVSVKESKRAIPFAENAVNLAKRNGDKKTLVAALGVSADAYGKSGDYALATERARQALDLDPTDAGARFLYSTYKDRSTAGADSLGAAAPAPAAAPASATGGSPAGATPAPAAAAPASGMTDAKSLTATKALSEGERMLALDPKKALEKFDEAVKAAPKDPRVLAARAQARLAAGDAAGALEDAQASVAAGGGGASFAVRAEAEKALKRPGPETRAEHLKRISTEAAAMRQDGSWHLDPPSIFRPLWANSAARLANRHGEEPATWNEFCDWAGNRTLNQLLRPTRSGSTYTSLGPQKDRYVYDPADPARIIDMRHFFAAGTRGRKGQWLGLGVEIFQWTASKIDKPSKRAGWAETAFDPQDFYSNAMGTDFFVHYYQPNGAPIEKQLRGYFQKREDAIK